MCSLALVVLIFILTIGNALAQEEVLPPDSTAVVEEAAYAQPVLNLQAEDKPNDAGGAVRVSWDVSTDDDGDGGIIGYTIYRGTAAAGPYEVVGQVPSGKSDFDDGNTADSLTYYYKVIAMNDALFSAGVTEVEMALATTAGPVQSSEQWFDFRRINVFAGTLLLSFLIIFMISRAKAGKKLFIRKIAGMEAVDEAVGRATEMGKKIFYVPGINDMDNVQTIASMTILGRVAELAGQYDTWLEVPVCRSLVMVTAKEVVKEAYTKVGRPDSFQENQVHYLTDDQFGYAAAIDGMVVREKPATIFYMGAFFAESLILAETGNATGAIQIAGTAMPSQLPFFVASCDYTLIGEELFAASAYLSREPKLLGSLKGQDMGKAIILVSMVVGIILETFGIWEFSQLFSVIE
ncbi:MAG: hypothetical protein GY867_05610 [bacterium]|nr:hypothetical protein [bacterium]